MLCTLCSQILGFVRDLTLSYFYGTSSFSDIFLIALTIVTVLYGFVIVALTTSYIPIYREVEVKSGLEGGLIYTKALIKITVAISSVIVIIVFIFGEQIINLFGQNLSIDEKLLTLSFVRIGILNIFFTGLVYIFSAFLQLKDSYVIPSAIGVPFNIVMIIGIVTSYTYYQYSLALAIGLSALAQLIFLIPFAKAKGFKWIREKKIDNSFIKKTFVISFPVIIGASLNDINITFSKVLASNHIVGGISAMNYSDRLIGLLYGLFIATIISITYPQISKEAVNNEISNITELVRKSLLGLCLILIPASVGYIALSKDIVSVVYGRGVFDQNSIEMTAGLLFFLAIGMIAIAFRDVLSRVFYAFQDTKTPVYNALIAITINMVLSIILIELMGINGLGLAISLSAFISAILLTISLKKKKILLLNKDFIISIIKICGLSTLMGILVHFIKSLLIGDDLYLNLIKLIICIVMGVGFYLGGILLINISVVESLKRKILNKSSR